MSRLYLITGFLGSGKTTFLRNFLSLLPGEKIRLIINEFGKEGIDGALLSDIHALMDEISGGSVFCACRLDQFEKALTACGKDETILVEASGLSDPTGVRRLFSQTDRFPHIEYMGGICLVDAVRFPKVYATARTCVRQIAASDLVLLNKTDLASKEQIETVRSLILGQRPDIPVLETSFGKIPENFLDLLAENQLGDREELPLISDLSTRRITVQLSDEITAYELEKFIQMFAENTFRVKGLIRTKDRGLVLADCVGNVVSVKEAGPAVPQDGKNVLNVLSGSRMPVYSAVRQACKWYPQYVISMKQA